VKEQVFQTDLDRLVLVDLHKDFLHFRYLSGSLTDYDKAPLSGTHCVSFKRPFLLWQAT
jgi:hypothetical protein